MTALVTLRSFAIAGTTAFLAACAVGPDYRAPEAPAAGAYGSGDFRRLVEALRFCGAR